jgi:uncharacterized protein (DUF427 family)
MKAIFNKTVVAQSDNTVTIEGNHYFPLESIYRDYFTKTSHHSTCPWKGRLYYTLNVNDELVKTQLGLITIQKMRLRK